MSVQTEAPAGKEQAPARSVRLHVRAIIATALLTAVVLGGASTLPGTLVGGLLAMIGVLYLVRSLMFSIRGILLGVVLVVMLVPVRRVKFNVPLSFALEPYRVVLVFAIVVVLVALLIDPKFSWRRAAFSGPIALFLASQLLSIAMNAGTLTQNGLGVNAISALSNFLLLFSVFFVVRQLLTGRAMLGLLLRALALCGGFVGLSAAVERITHFNVFLLIGQIPPLTLMATDETILRSGGARAFGSAQHPVALSVVFCMLLPLAVHLAVNSTWPKRSRVRFVLWSACAVAMGAGMIATVSRTAVIVLLVMIAIACMLRPGLIGQFVKIGLPLAALAALSSPGTVRTLILNFLHPSELVQSQYASPGWRGSGRLADLGPSLVEAQPHILFGTGLGSRVVAGPQANAFILDDQLLDTLLESGIVGLLAAIVLILVPAWRLLNRAQTWGVSEPDGDLALALALGMIGYATSLFFFDAFGFLQTFMVFCMMLAAGSWLLTEGSQRPTIAPPDLARRALART